MHQFDRIEQDLQIIKDRLGASDDAKSKAEINSAIERMFKSMIDYRKIDAIREYRSLTGASLKDSKDAIEMITDRMVRKSND